MGDEEASAMRHSSTQTRLPWLLASLLALALQGCDQAAESPQDESEPPSPISGRYEVSGETVTKSTGDKREISGTLIVAADEAGKYIATFDFSTTYPGADSAMPAEVIGKGEGSVEGRTLLGTAHTQLVMATVPGVDPGFAYIPRMVSTRIVSNSTATIARDGAVTITIRSVPAKGEEYEPTRTTLHGRRLSAAGVGGE
jgi:hypothetical protein